jgi:hypothetical protein
LFVSATVFGQDKLESKETKTINPSDTIPYKFGLRIGIDIAGPIAMIVNGNHKLFKGNFDARVYKKYFVSGEFGYEKFYSDTQSLKYTSDGAFIMLGGDYDMLGYTPGRNDLMAFGVRYGFATFNQTVNQYSIQNGYWNDDTHNGNIEAQKANAHWINVRMGLKVEVLHNFYLGLSSGVNFLFHDTNLENFDNLYIPGFGENKNNKSFIFNYTLMYFLPFN